MTKHTWTVKVTYEVSLYNPQRLIAPAFQSDEDYEFYRDENEGGVAFTAIDMLGLIAGTVQGTLYWGKQKRPAHPPTWRWEVVDDVSNLHETWGSWDYIVRQPSNTDAPEVVSVENNDAV